MDLMNRLFKPYLEKFILIFIDEILIYSRSKEEHVKHLRTVLRTLKEYKLYAIPKKCEFWLDRVHFLGYIVIKDGISVAPTKVEAVVNWPRPITVVEVMSFLGMVGDYKRFIEGFFKLALPITKLIHKNTKFEWFEE